MNEKEYRAHPAIARSDLVVMIQTIEHWEHNKENPKTSPAMEFGTAFHAAILEPEKFKNDYIVMPKFDKRTKVGKAAYAEWILEHSSKKPIKDEDMIHIAAMVKNVKANKICENLLKIGEIEKPFFGRCEKHKIDYKCRADLVTPDIALDFKTCENASRSAFAHEIKKWWLDVQGAFYLMATGRKYFIFCACEKKPPYGVALYRLNDASIEVGAEIVDKTLLKYRNYLDKKIPRGYSPEIQDIGLPAYGFDVDSRLGD